MLTGRPVRVVGGGVAGLAAAAALAQRGARVVLHEQADEIAEVGAGIQVSPNGAAVLAALGLGDELARRGVAATAVVLRDFRRGARVLRLDIARHHRGAHGFWFLHRARLIAMLERAAREAGVAIRLGERVDDPSGALTVAADGVKSVFRARLNGDRPAAFTGQVAWRAVLEDDAPPEAQVWMGPGRHLVTYPLRSGLRNIVAVEERAAWAEEGWRHADDPDNLRRAFAGFAPEVGGWLERVERVNLWGLFRHPVAARWHGDGVVLAGDAAHPTLPFLAQGANLALEDAWVLARRLGERPVAEALAVYQAERRPRVARAVAAAAANARNYHLRHPLVRGAAHVALRMGGALAPAAALGRFDWLYGHDVTA